MPEQLTRQITNLAHSIDVRINLFEGYVPKQIDSYKGELRFWREVVSIYAIFADCDRVSAVQVLFEPARQLLPDISE